MTEKQKPNKKRPKRQTETELKICCFFLANKPPDGFEISVGAQGKTMPYKELMP